MSTTKNKTINNKKKWLIAVGTFVLLYLISLGVPYISAYTKYPLYVVKCGGEPVIGSNLKSRIYYPVGHILHNVKPGNDYYFCTNAEAEEAGFERLSN